MQYGMVIDLKTCIGCTACVVACKSHNNVPKDVQWSRIDVEENGKYPNVFIERTPMLCMNCQNPPCVPVCPSGATFRNDNGIVNMDRTKCQGCGECVNACPYGARTLLDGTPESYFPGMTPTALEALQKSAFPANTTSKCEFCKERVANGEQPACVATCPANARFFGDLNDKNSVVYKLIKSGKGYQLDADLGTIPSVYYLPR